MRRVPVHDVEVFADAELQPRNPWGWQCFTPGCEDERAGYTTFEAAEEAADAHANDTETEA
ncbi:hypothetical protein CLV30_12861 [Haloactinopolyspora alba]|uniref:Uncharacterized protein n=1 Tax=Haloactinopolyspora alba TaxID=648780 RepID=A0A2P8DF30_9ACTN|nr:hypothetical protein [Haloactinopolyspora alba]PSK95809.1 hypothetical protein CLV30_12861 [Haloactinopolyspora alba]